ncbi:DUF1127 domain-containing protein [Roseospira goensis]|uniref:Uncharacterized protein YjiS (DUF1127 family) n=1 Tax=Roseospira goensis TaxID=391922 RepID=A0A7W6S277_9PROT|nr:DUF1127 domain-containing protein [Roseospira goensis]MBB4287381.1 uncharacterized protein YjiS (DUF1127 family) [Roseospira goensis]
MWPYVDHTHEGRQTPEGAALHQASAVGTVLSAPFTMLPATFADALPANDRVGGPGDPLARHRWYGEREARPASNDDHWFRHGPIGWLVRTVRRWLERRELEATLLAMDDHQLEDIGLTRSDIDAVVAGRFQRPLP